MSSIFLHRYVQVIKVLITGIEKNDIPPILRVCIHSSKLANRLAEILKRPNIKLRFISCLANLSRWALLRLVKVWLVWNCLCLMVTRLRACLPRRLDSIPVRDKIISLPRCSQTGGGTTNSSIRFVQGALSPRCVTSIQCRSEECVDLFWLSSTLFHDIVLI